MSCTLLAIEMFEDGDQMGLRYQNGNPHEPVTTEMFDRLIALLGQIRPSVQPSIQADPPSPGRPISAIYDPRWQISNDPMGGGAVLKIRHPGFGWLTFSIPLHELVRFAGGVEQIAQTMTNDAPDPRRAN